MHEDIRVSSQHPAFRRILLTQNPSLAVWPTITIPGELLMPGYYNITVVGNFGDATRVSYSAAIGVKFEVINSNIVPQMTLVSKPTVDFG